MPQNALVNAALTISGSPGCGLTCVSVGSETPCPFHSAWDPNQAQTRQGWYLIPLRPLSVLSLSVPGTILPSQDVSISPPPNGSSLVGYNYFLRQGRGKLIEWRAFFPFYLDLSRIAVFGHHQTTTLSSAKCPCRRRAVRIPRIFFQSTTANYPLCCSRQFLTDSQPFPAE